jgi:hypothetical protein
MVGFCIHDVVIESRLGRVYVNGHRFDKMPGVYRSTIPKIVEHFSGDQVDNERGLKEWVRKREGEPRTFKCSGVMVELCDDDLYCTPFFMFTDQVVELLKPGWERWLAAKEDYKKKQEESFLAHAQAEAYQRQQQQVKLIQQLQLNLQAYDAGLFDLWEVEMYPPAGKYGMPLSVVVPAVNNLKAAEAAKQKNPSYVVGPMRVVRRRNHPAWLLSMIQCGISFSMVPAVYSEPSSARYTSRNHIGVGAAFRPFPTTFYCGGPHE